LLFVRPVFTEFVRGLDRFDIALDPASFAEVWGKLQSILAQELRRRGLWASPPAYFGIYGWTNWDAAGVSADDGPIAELTAECYSFIFVDRLAALRAQLAVKPNVEGLVLLNVRHFLHERQRAHDPIGSRVFEVLREAVREAVAAGELLVLAGDSGIRNDTVLGFEPRPDLVEREPAGQDLGTLVARWNDGLLPRLLTARGRQQTEVLSRLRACLRELEGAGIRSFTFRAVVDPLKNDTRARWAALMEEARGERERRPPGGQKLTDERVSTPLMPPETAVEIEDSFAHLSGQVTAAIEERSTDPRMRRYLASLWSFLRLQASERVDDTDWEHLSHRKLGQLLDIPRERVPELFAALRQIVEQCRKERWPVPRQTAGRGVDGMGTPGSPKRKRKMDRNRLELGL
jgi:hypothetical protein